MFSRRLKLPQKKFTGDATDEAVWNTILKPIADEKGYDISLDDYKSYIDKLNTSDELSSDEMANVAGGSFTFCVFIGGSGGKEVRADTEDGYGACYYVGVGVFAISPDD